MSVSGPEVVEQSYSPEQFGERVGWVHVARVERDDRPDFIRLDMAMAFVGPDGATVSYVEREEGARGYIGDHSIRGFIGGVSIGGAYNAEKGIEEHSQVVITTSGMHRFQQFPISGNYVMHQASGLNSHAYNDAPPEKQWASGESQFLDVLVQALADKDSEANYADLYYLLNHAALHSHFAPNDEELAILEGASLAIPDPSMQAKTHQEHQIAEQVAKNFDTVKRLDVQMLDWLAFGPEFDDMAERFESSRRTAGRLERNNQLLKRAMTQGDLAWVGTGFRPDGRTWPYMDPLAEDPHAAYGRELQLLRAGEPVIARRELADELRELEKRRNYANGGVQALGELMLAEQAATEVVAV